MEQGQDTKMKNSVDYVKAIEGGVQPSQVTTFSAKRRLVLNSSEPLENLYLVTLFQCVLINFLKINEALVLCEFCRYLNIRVYVDMSVY